MVVMGNHFAAYHSALLVNLQWLSAGNGRLLLGTHTEVHSKSLMDSEAPLPVGLTLGVKENLGFA